MARYKPYNYAQSMMMPIILEQQLVPGTLEFAIHYLVDHDLDLSRLDRRFRNDDTGRLAYDPRVLADFGQIGHWFRLKPATVSVKSATPRTACPGRGSAGLEPVYLKSMSMATF